LTALSLFNFSDYPMLGWFKGIIPCFVFQWLNAFDFIFFLYHHSLIKIGTYVLNRGRIYWRILCCIICINKRLMNFVFVNLPSSFWKFGIAILIDTLFELTHLFLPALWKELFKTNFDLLTVFILVLKRDFLAYGVKIVFFDIKNVDIEIVSIVTHRCVGLN